METTAPPWKIPSWSTHSAEEIQHVWHVLSDVYELNEGNPIAAGARAAAEWSLGLSQVSPVTNERKVPDRLACQWESHYANMREMGLGKQPDDQEEALSRRRYGMGARAWLFWWTGLEPLPDWLRRSRPADPMAS